MHHLIEDFFMNMFVIIFTLFLNSLFQSKKPIRSTSKKSITLIGGVIQLILIMVFPIQLDGGFSIDLRQVPLIVGFLYSGPLVGVGLYLFSIFFSILIGEAYLFGIIYTHTLFLISLFILSGKYNKLSIVKKHASMLFLSLLTFIYIISAMVFFYKVEMKIVAILGILYIMQSFVLILVVFFIEKMRDNSLKFEKLVKVEKLEVIGQLAASISHEVRNPLTASRGFIQLLDKDDITTKKRKEYINLALGELDQANQIITDFLTFAKPSLDKTENINISDELKEIVEIIRSYAQLKNVEVSSEILADQYILGDVQKLHQCLINLAKNRIKAMPFGGNLKIELVRQGRSTIIHVQDNGIGISPEQIHRLGEPYFSTKLDGTGLDIMVIFSLIKAMQGDIQVESEQGKGTSYIISFPAIDQII